jgi:hypothetical protein
MEQADTDKPHQFVDGINYLSPAVFAEVTHMMINSDTGVVTPEQLKLVKSYVRERMSHGFNSG